MWLNLLGFVSIMGPYDRAICNLGLIRMNTTNFLIFEPQFSFNFISRGCGIVVTISVLYHTLWTLQPTLLWPGLNPEGYRGQIFERGLDLSVICVLVFNSWCNFSFFLFLFSLPKMLSNPKLTKSQLQSKLERLWSVPSFKDIAMRTDQLDSNYLHKDGLLRVRRSATFCK